jgi:hypothetical protein
LIKFAKNLRHQPKIHELVPPPASLRQHEFFNGLFLDFLNANFIGGSFFFLIELNERNHTSHRISGLDWGPGFQGESWSQCAPGAAALR